MCLSFPESRHIVRYKIVSVTHLVLPTLTTSWTIRAFEKDVSSTSGARARDSAKKRLKSVYFVNCLREWRTYYVRIYRYPPIPERCIYKKIPKNAIYRYPPNYYVLSLFRSDVFSYLKELRAFLIWNMKYIFVFISFPFIRILSQPFPKNTSPFLP